MATIRHTISLEGGESIRRAMDDFARAGENAFKKIKGAGDDIKFSSVRDEANKVGDAFKKAGDDTAASLNKIKQSADGIGPAAQGAAQTVSQSFQQAGVSVDGFSNKLVDTAFKFNTIIDAAQKVGSVIGAVTGAISGFVTEGGKFGAEIAKGAEEAGLTAERFQTLKSVLGEDAAKSFNKVTSAAGEFVLQMSRGGETSRTFTDGVTTQMFSVTKAAQEAAAASREKAKADEDAADADDDVAASSAKAGKEIAQTTVRVRNFGSAAGTEIPNQMSKAAQAIQELGVNISQTDDALDVLRKLVAAFEKVDDPIARNRLGVQLLGDEWKKFRPVVLGGVEAFDKAVSEAEKSTRRLTNSEAEGLAAFNAQVKDLDEAIKILKAKVGAVFAPDQAEGKKFFSDLIDKNQELIIGLVRTAKAKVDAFFNAKDAEGATAFERALKALERAGVALVAVWDNFLLPAIKAVDAGFEAAAKKINELFGTNINGLFLEIAVAATALGASFLGLTGNLGSLLGAIASVIGVLVPFAPLLITLGGAAFLFWNQLKTAGLAAFEALGPAMEVFQQGLGKLLKGDFAGAWQDFALAGERAWSDLTPVMQAFWAAIKVRMAELWQDFKQLAADAWAGLKADETIGPFLTAVERGFTIIIDIFTVAKNVLDKIGLSFTSLAEGINRIFGTSFSGGEVALITLLGKVTGLLDNTKIAAFAASVGVTNLALDAKAAADGLATMPDKAKGLFDGLLNSVGNFFGLIKTGSADAAAQLRQPADTAVGLSDKLKAAGDTVANMKLEQPVRLFKDETEKATNALAPLNAAIVKTADNAEKLGVKLALPSAGSAVPPVSDEALSSVDDFRSRMEAVGGAVASVGDAIPKAITVPKSAAEGAQNLIDETLKNGGKLIELRKELEAMKPPKLFEGVGDEAQTAGQDAADKITQPFDAAGTKAGQSFWEKWRESTNVDDRRGEISVGPFLRFEEEAQKTATAVAEIFNQLFQAIANPANFSGSAAAGTAGDVATGTGGLFSSLVDQARLAFDEIKRLASEAGQALQGLLSGGPGATPATPGEGQGAPGVSGGMFAGILAGFDQVKAGAADVATSIQASLDAINFLGLETALADGITRVFTQVQELVTRIGELFQTDLPTAVQGGMSSVQSAVESMVTAVTASLQALKAEIAAVAEAAAAANAAGAGGSSNGSENAGGFASGGRVRGRGTSTSDSILAWLSNNEFVMRSAAVRKYGAGFMSAINSLRLPRGLIPGFAAGGLAVPGFSMAPIAIGGSSGHPLTIVLPGGQMVSGLTADDDAVSQLQMAARGAHVAATGRLPRWV